MSLSQVGLIGGISLDFVGLDNWTRLFTDGAVWGSWVRSVVYFVLTVGLRDDARRRRSRWRSTS